WRSGLGRPFPACTVGAILPPTKFCRGARQHTERCAQHACAPQIDRPYAIFLRKRSAQRMKSKFDIRMRTRRFGQYSKKFAPRRMIARMSAMKYVVGKRAPSA